MTPGLFLCSPYGTKPPAASAKRILLRQRQSFVLTPQDAPLDQTLQVKFGAGWTADEGDALEVVATFKVTAGANHDYTLARSAAFVVVG